MDILLYAHTIYNRLRLIKMLISAAFAMLLFGEVHQKIDKSYISKNEKRDNFSKNKSLSYLYDFKSTNSVSYHLHFLGG